MQINSGYGDAKEERLQRILVDFKFTDYSHETLESVTVNLKDLFEEYGYIPKAKAIPIEWIEKKLNCCDNINAEIFVKVLIKEWRKENDFATNSRLGNRSNGDNDSNISSTTNSGDYKDSITR